MSEVWREVGMQMLLSIHRNHMGMSYLSLNLIEKHIFTEDHEMHRDAVLEQIDKTISVELVKLNAEYKQDIRNYAQSKIEQDNANRLKQQQAESKREKSRLPFVR
jgi:hypothetical protein